ncbi:hypothetical protein [Hydrogenimonas cancrithermarum]|uniref:Uncharacterized protein n=1 Tax=Hydrogenimonas cancrithermarum TaxID=2993563 RepID=A0ABN6WV11_9BACT|nr:hypothetical protein [Hydrogenimonas cancrithermarum]BDY12706.1 hypothetical protein HCR_10180 [Hydrogenimonas cancrithermarum]
MGKLRRYFWPKTALLFYLDDEKIEAAFGYVEEGGVDIQERRTIAIGKERELGEWLEEIRRTYPKIYVSAMLDTINQGALPSCSKSSFERFGVDASLVHSICIDESWLAYTSLVEMKWFEKKFEGVDFDFLYSPFVLLYRRCRPLLEARPGLFVLHQSGTLFLAVFSEERMWYAQVLLVADGEVKEEMMEEEDEGLEELAFDLEEIGEDVEPISDVDMLGEFKEELEPKERGVEDASALELLEYNLDLFEEMKDAIAKFYHDDRYPHEFIEKVTIFDMDDLGSDLVRYIGDELFMEASLHRFDPIETMAELVAEETGN